jgi:sortase A
VTEPGAPHRSSSRLAEESLGYGERQSHGGRASLLWTERALLAAGTILLGFYGGARVDGWISSSAALDSFDRAAPPRQSDVQSAEANRARDLVDVSLWSPERIRGFRDSLWLTEDRALAVLELDQLELRVPVFEGTDNFVLNRGAGWIQGTARPGEEGNVGIAAHRDGFFRPLMHVQMGDPIRLRSPLKTMMYRVDGIEIVDPEDVHVLLPRGMPSLTLVTCYPFYYTGNAPHRFIVHAALDTQVALED